MTGSYQLQYCGIQQVVAARRSSRTTTDEGEGGVVRLLIAAGVDTNKATIDLGATPLYSALATSLARRTRRSREPLDQDRRGLQQGDDRLRSDTAVNRQGTWRDCAALGHGRSGL